MAVRTPIGLLSYPHVFAARAAAPGAEAKFSCALLFDKNAQSTQAFADLRAAVGAAIDDFFGQGKSKDREFVKTLRSPFRRTESKQARGYTDMPDGIFIQPWSRTRPGVVDARLQEITVPADVWPGQMARATVRAFGYNQSGNKGVSFNLNNLQICRIDGPRLDDRRAANQDFDVYGDPVGVDEEADTPFFLVPEGLGMGLLFGPNAGPCEGEPL